MHYSNQDLIEQIPLGNRRALARLITLSENGVPRAKEVQSKLFRHTGKAQVIGVTGSPGSGKSTLVDEMVRGFRKLGKSVAVLAVDPTSPFSGGAVLGDRIRMQRAVEDSEVFVRSMATRGSLGGLSRATMDTIQTLDAAGFEIIIVETVGVGQQEVDIVRTADTCLVVLVPGMGDSVQAIKAGILEIADHFIINKSDREGADQLHKDLRILLSLGTTAAEDWKPSILKTIAIEGKGIEEVLAGIDAHREWLEKSDEGKRRRLENFKENIKKLARDLIYEQVAAREKQIEDLAQKVHDRTLDPYAAVTELLKEIKLSEI